MRLTRETIDAGHALGCPTIPGDDAAPHAFVWYDRDEELYVARIGRDGLRSSYWGPIVSWLGGDPFCGQHPAGSLAACDAWGHCSRAGLDTD